MDANEFRDYIDEPAFFVKLIPVSLSKGIPINRFKIHRILAFFYLVEVLSFIIFHHHIGRFFTAFKESSANDFRAYRKTRRKHLRTRAHFFFIGAWDECHTFHVLLNQFLLLAKIHAFENFDL